MKLKRNYRRSSPLSYIKGGLKRQANALRIESRYSMLVLDSKLRRRLSTLGVVFQKVTEKGNPIVDEAVLDTIDLPEARSISSMMLQKRYAQVHSWLEHVQDDGRVHGRVISNGAVTGRMTHQSPNMAQVPASHSPYGHECRSCWTVPEGSFGWLRRFWVGT